MMSEPTLATAHLIVPQIVAKTSFVLSLSIKNLKNFITIDKPDYIGNFVSVKGFFCEKEVNEIVTDYQQIIKNIKKEEILEMVFPSEKINFVRSLVFKSK